MEFMHKSPFIIELLDRVNHCVDQSMLEKLNEENWFSFINDVEYITKICIALKFLAHNKQNLLLIEEFKGSGSLMICLMHFE